MGTQIGMLILLLGFILLMEMFQVGGQRFLLQGLLQ